MTKKYRPEQCPSCHWNMDASSCMSSHTYTMPGDLVKTLHTGWSPFEGYTERQCKRFKLKQIVSSNHTQNPVTSEIQEKVQV